MADSSHQFLQFLAGTLPVGALAGNTAIVTTTVVDGARRQGVRIRKVKFSWYASGKTSAEGPIHWGLCINASLAEIKDFYNADPQGRLDDDKYMPSAKGAKVFHIATMPELTTSVGKVAESQDGLEFRSLRGWPSSWSVPEGVSLVTYAFNAGAGALTTGTVIQPFFWLNGEWLDD